MRSIHLKQIELPEFGFCEELTEIPASQFELRFQNTVKKMQEQTLDFLLVFADREHCANLTFLTNLASANC